MPMGQMADHPHVVWEEPTVGIFLEKATFHGEDEREGVSRSSDAEWERPSRTSFIVYPVCAPGSGMKQP